MNKISCASDGPVLEPDISTNLLSNDFLLILSSQQPLHSMNLMSPVDLIHTFFNNTCVASIGSYR